MVIGERGNVTLRPSREGHGTSEVWARDINGKRYSFTFVVMPNGECRYFVSVYNGYLDDGTPEGRLSGMRFGCAWTRVHSITFPAAPAPRGWDRIEA